MTDNENTQKIEVSARLQQVEREKESIQNAASKIIDSYGFGHKHIFNLGHGIDQFVNPDNLNVLIKHVKDYSVKYHNH